MGTIQSTSAQAIENTDTAKLSSPWLSQSNLHFGIHMSTLQYNTIILFPSRLEYKKIISANNLYMEKLRRQNTIGQFKY